MDLLHQCNFVQSIISNIFSSCSMDIREKDIVKTMIIVFGCIYSLIELLQEFTYPRVGFLCTKRFNIRYLMM